MVYCSKKECPNFPDLQNFTYSCIQTGIYNLCTVKCNPGFMPDNPVGIMCSSEGKWDLKDLPKCEPYCGPPQLSENMVILNYCTYDMDSNCRLSCVGDDYYLKPPIPPVLEADTTCLNTGNWSLITECKKICPFDLLRKRGLKLPEDCDPLLSGDECFLSCDQPNHVVPGNISVKCVNGEIIHDETFKLECVEKCTLPNDLPRNLKISDECLQQNLYYLGYKCKLECRNMMKISNPNYIECSPLRKWSDYPTCDLICPPPNPYEGSYMVGICNTRDGSECTVKCHHKDRKFDSGSSQMTVTCLNGAWFGFQPCRSSCNKTVFEEKGLKVIEPCLGHFGDKCSVYCKNHVLVGNPQVLCINSEWFNIPSCVGKCEMPYLQDKYLDFNGPCAAFLNHECKVKCIRPSVYMDGSSKISCKEMESNQRPQWNKIPKCLLNIPLKCTVIPPYLRVRAKTCKVSGENKTCTYRCKDSKYKIYGQKSVTCFKDLIFPSWPDCIIKVKSPPSKCFLPKSFKVEDGCRLRIGKTCEIRCKIDGYRIMKIGESTFSTSISYTCKDNVKKPGNAVQPRLMCTGGPDGTFN